MKRIIIFSLIILAGCEKSMSISDLKSPVILIGKDSTEHGYCVVIKDADGVVLSFNQTFVFAQAIGASRNIGDTIK